MLMNVPKYDANNKPVRYPSIVTDGHQIEKQGAKKAEVNKEWIYWTQNVAALKINHCIPRARVWRLPGAFAAGVPVLGMVFEAFASHCGS